MPRRIAPAKQAARLLQEKAQVKIKEQATQRRLYANSIVQQLQRVAKEQKRKKERRAVGSGPGIGRADVNEAWTR
jgi:hypothetical protein